MYLGIETKRNGIKIFYFGSLIKKKIFKEFFIVFKTLDFSLFLVFNYENNILVM
jgi:hypothetical protein